MSRKKYKKQQPFIIYGTSGELKVLEIGSAQAREMCKIVETAF